MLTALTIASIRRNKARFWTQVAISFVVGSAIAGSILVTNFGTNEIESSVLEAGALTYGLTAFDDTDGENTPVSDAALEALGNASNVLSVSARQPIAVEAVGPNAVTGTAAAVTPGHPSLQTATVVAGAPLVGAGGFAVATVQAAKRMGITEGCVETLSCSVSVGDQSFVIAGIIETVVPTTEVLIDMTEAIGSGLIEGPFRVEVVAGGFPQRSVAESLDAISSIDGDRIIVEQSDVGAVRSGIASTWSTTITASAVGALALSAIGQAALQMTSVRSRRPEIATLRSLGCTPTFVFGQFMAEPLLASVAGTAMALFGVATVTRWLTLAHNVNGLSLGPQQLLLVCGVGIATCVVAAASSTVEAVAVPPTEALTA